MKLYIRDNNHAMMHVVVISWNLSFCLLAEDKKSQLLFWFKFLDYDIDHVLAFIEQIVKTLLSHLTQFWDGEWAKLPPMLIFSKLNKSCKSYENETLPLLIKMIWAHFRKGFSFQTPWDSDY